MWKTKDRKVFITLGILAVLGLIITGIVFAQPKEEAIELTFKDDIKVVQNSKLDIDILVKDTNADTVKIRTGNAESIGKQKITVTAKKASKEKDFSTMIEIIEENTNFKSENEESNKEKEINKNDKDDKEADETNKKKSDNSQSSKKSQSSVVNEATSEPEKENSSANNGSSGSTSQQPSQPQKPSQPEVPHLSESEYASQIASLVNQYRVSQGLSALYASETLQSLSDQRANDMAQMGHASHTRPDGTAADYFWVEDTYGIKAGGEDVFGGSSGFTPDAVVNSFINSAGHRAPIIDYENSYMAVGVRFSGGQVFVSLNFQMP